MIRPILEYGDLIFDSSPACHTDRLENVQCQVDLTCTGAYRHTKHENLLEGLGWAQLSLKHKQHRFNIMFKLQNGLAPLYI